MSETIIKELRLGKETYYKRTVVLSDGKQIISDIRPQTAVVKLKNQEYFVLYDSKMNVDRNIFRYLNYSYNSTIARNTKVKAMEAFKFLIAFEEINDKKLEEFKLEDINTFKSFLSGNFSKLKGREYTLDLITQRSNATINGYLTIYRRFIKFLEIQEHPLLNITKQGYWTSTNDDNKYKHSDKYNTNEKLPKQVIEVPEYITVPQYIKILKLVRSKYTLREECMIRLMFECGTRVSENLGLTFEDCREEKDNDGNYHNVLIIRNRVSDHKDMVAKGCITVTSKEQYTSPDYNTEAISGGGYQKIVIDKDLADLINDYIESAHSKATSTKTSKARYESKTKADRVTPKANPYDNDENYYVFLNDLGTPLHQDVWNKTLRSIYEECDIPLDKGKRKHNLNHRLRHGFAMFHVQYLGTKQVVLSKELRHSNINSSNPYTKMTLTDQIELKTAFSDKLHEIVPLLSFNKEV